MQKKNPTILIFLFVIVLSCVSLAQQANPSQPAYAAELGSIHNIDGIYSEWNHSLLGLDYYFFAEMHQAAKSSKKVESNLYLRYDCTNNNLYILVLAYEQGMALVQGDDAFVKLGNSTKLVDGSSSNISNGYFAWINQSGTRADGFEARVTLAEGTYSNFNVHLQVFDDGESQTSAVIERAIELIIDCDSSLPVELGDFEASVENNDIVLNWVTESESENIGFEVYLSSTENGNFHMISSYLTNPYLIGQGNSTTKHSYSYIIKNPGNGTFWIKLADVTVNDEKTFHSPISIIMDTEIPQNIQLDPNYPNPFNPSTNISYQLSKSGYINMAIYNLRGELVSTLISKKQNAGKYSIDWIARDMKGDELPSGVYILRLSSGNIIKSHKIMLMR